MQDESLSLETFVSSEILAAIKNIELRAKHMVEEQLIGNYRSHFKGSGISFSDLRQYNAGDEIRHIHWKASARTNKTYVKTYQEERQLGVMLLIDMSNSMGAHNQNPLFKQAVELSALLAFLARAHGDLLGLCRFSSSVEAFVPCSNRRNNFYRVLHDLLRTHSQTDNFTDLASALTLVRHRLKRRTLIFIVSDFMAPDYADELKALSKGHDCVCSILSHSIPDRSCGLVRMKDAETGESFLIDTGTKRARNKIKQRLEEHRSAVLATCQAANSDYFFLDSDVASSLRNFMRRR